MTNTVELTRNSKLSFTLQGNNVEKRGTTL